jgi:hypothetical protein
VLGAAWGCGLGGDTSTLLSAPLFLNCALTSRAGVMLALLCRRVGLRGGEGATGRVRSARGPQHRAWLECVNVWAAGTQAAAGLGAGKLCWPALHSLLAVAARPGRGRGGGLGCGAAHQSACWPAMPTARAAQRRRRPGERRRACRKLPQVDTQLCVLARARHACISSSASR